MQLPAQIGNYRVEEFIGGGPSKVYRAFDTVLERMVAVRLLADTGGQDAAGREFLRAEAKRAATIRHDHIIQIFEYGEAGVYGPFVVMEFLRGKELVRAIADQSMGDLSNKLRIGLQVASALEYLHGRDIVNCDIRPDKILVGESGTVKLMDSAIAHFDEPAVVRTVHNLGAAYCTVPEHRAGEKLTGRADIFVFGALLFEIVSGVAPGTFVRFAEPLHQALLPERVRRLISDCANEDPAARPANFSAVCEALRQIIAELEKGKVEPAEVHSYQPKAGARRSSKAHDARCAKLRADYSDLMNLAASSKFIQVEPLDMEPGWPPEKYLITFTCNGIAAIRNDGTPIISAHHQVQIYLSADYPARLASLRWRTDIWHPNIDHKEPRHVCIDAGLFAFASKPISELVLFMGEMVQYRRYQAKIEPPYPLDLEVARWVLEVAEPRGWFAPDRPFDPRPLLTEHRIGSFHSGIRLGAEKTGEFTRLLQVPQAQAPATARERPGEFTRLLQAPTAQVPPPGKARTGEFTRMFGSSSATPAPPPLEPAPELSEERTVDTVWDTPAAAPPVLSRDLPPETASRSEQRMLDLALAKVAVVWRPVELHALLRLCESASLGPLLAQDPDATLRADAVRSRKFGLEFLRDRSGKLRPVDVTMRVIAPSFEPPEIRKVVRVRPAEDSEHQVFLLTPKVTGDLKVQFDLLAGAITIASRCLTIDAEAGELDTPAPKVLVSVPFELEVRPRRRWIPPVIAAAAAVVVAGLFLWHSRGQQAESAEWRPLPRALVSVAEGRTFDKEAALAIVVGINTYSRHSGVNDLNYAVNDARDIGKALAGHGYKVRTLVDADAPMGEIRAALREAHAQLARDTGTLIFFFSGHGVNEGGRQYLMTYGATTQDLSEALSLDDLRDLMDATQARQKVILIDACRDRARADASRGDSGPDFGRLRWLARSRGLRILNSTEPGQRSWEYADLRHGLFTSALLQVLEGGFERPDSYITFADLANQTFRQMSTESFDDVEHRRNPQTPWEGGEASGDFILENLHSR